jgi:hypothetical protein
MEGKITHQFLALRFLSLRHGGSWARATSSSLTDLKEKTKYNIGIEE